MIARILKQASTKDSLTYNQDKEKIGMAKKLEVRNLPKGRPDLIIPIFEYYENKLELRKGAKKRGFHMTLSPAFNETMTDEKAVQLIDKLMERLGMKKQPYIIYKHEDTGHEHYHVISTMVQKNGRITGNLIDSSNDRFKLQAALKEFETDFQYKLGKNKEYNPEYKRQQKFSIKNKNVHKQIQDLFEDSLDYFYENREEFEAILESKNIMPQKLRDKENYAFFGLGHSGRKITQPQYNVISDQDIKKIDTKASPFFRYNNMDAQKNTQELIEQAFYATNSKKGFQEYLRGYNIDVVWKQTKKGEYKEIYYVNNDTKTIFPHSKFEDSFTLAMMNYLATKRWAEKEEKEKRLDENKKQKNENKIHENINTRKL